MTSPIDRLFREIFGELPTKAGAAYERLAAIAMYILEEGSVKHDALLKGQFSNTSYQLDVRHESKGDRTSTMGEAKDYSEQGNKVGRGDLQKLGGALPDLGEIDAGAFFSATGYTQPAKKYAEASRQITGGKSIALYELAESTADDEKGTINSIVIRLHVLAANHRTSVFNPVFTPEGVSVLKKYFQDAGTISCPIDALYDANGARVVTIFDLTSKGFGDIDASTRCARACYWLPGLRVLVRGHLIPISGIEYTVPFTYTQTDISVSADAGRRLVIRDKNGLPIRILTDKQLRKFSFDADGRVVRDR
jgi:hypothetical protein